MPRRPRTLPDSRRRTFAGAARGGGNWARGGGARCVRAPGRSLPPPPSLKGRGSRVLSHARGLGQPGCILQRGEQRAETFAPRPAGFGEFTGQVVRGRLVGG